MWKGHPFQLKVYDRDTFFCENGMQKGEGLDLEAKPQV